VLVTSEASLPADLAERRVSVAPHRMHDLLAHADVFVGESGTMAAEAAVLGTPAVYVSSRGLGYLDELERIYGLVANFDGPDRHERALERVVSILESENQTEWAVRRALLFEDKVDTTDVIVGEITAEGTGEPSRLRTATPSGD